LTHVDRKHLPPPLRLRCVNHHYSLAHAGLRRARTDRLRAVFSFLDSPPHHTRFTTETMR
jgi:hypothetical protein